jgi:periplasmic divalent cation tolerance protein
MPDYVQITTTVPTRADADRIARALVERRLAACIQVSGPITSTYRWKGTIETAEEWYCHAKTRRGLCASVEKAIKELHPYEVPEIVAVPIVAGSAEYLKWIDESTGEGQPPS